MKEKIILQNIHKEYLKDNEKICAIEDVSFSVNKGEVVAIVGMSGCGKSTLLNIISGLDEEYQGEITFDKDKPVISYMLQTDALLSYKNIFDNACLGLNLTKKETPKAKKYVKELLSNYGLSEFLNKYPYELSGGMRQRVSLVRSLAILPEILLLDEPFSALDYHTRLSISEDVRKIIKKLKMTAILITHDIGEACLLADKVVVLSNRPSRVKNVYMINLPENLSILEKRRTVEFDNLYSKIWEDLNEEDCTT